MRRMLMVIGLVVASVAGAVPLEYPEGDLRGFPTLLDLQGNLLGRGRFAQWVDREGLHVRATYDETNGGRIVETALMSMEGDELGQRSWSWQRSIGGRVVERYSLNLDTGEARSLVVRGGKLDQRRSRLEVVPGRTFSGIGFIYAVRNLHPRLERGEKVELEGIAFLPKARKAKVTLSHEGSEAIRVGGRSVRADHIVIHPNVPRVARAFVNVPDSHIWLTRAHPPSFVRAEIQMQSLGMVRIDSVPSGPPAVGRRRPPR